MTAVTSSSHSPKMSSLERQSTPPAASAAGVGDDVEKAPTIAAGDGTFTSHNPTPVKPPALKAYTRDHLQTAPYVSSLKVHDSAFVNAHLTRCPPNLLESIKTKTNRNLVKSIAKAKVEGSMYSKLSQLLTNISKTLWKGTFIVLPMNGVRHETHSS